MKTMDFSETIGACDLKVGRCRQLIEIMKLYEYWTSRSFSLPYIFQILYVLCFLRPRYQVSVYRTIGPLVLISILDLKGKKIIHISIAVMRVCQTPIAHSCKTATRSFEPRHEKTNILHMRKQRRRSASRLPRS